MAATITKKKWSYTLSEWKGILACLPGYDSFRDAANCIFDVSAANKVIRFFETRIRHVKGKMAGKLITLEKWQKAILGAIFGWKQADGWRRYREIFLYIPRKNGKTIFIAGIAVLLLACSAEGGQEIYSAAAEKEQAKIAHEMAKGMVQQEKDLGDIITIYKDSLHVSNGGHFYKAISAEAYSKHGFNASAILVDEVHAHPNGELIEVLKTSTGARAQPLTFYATTADYDRPSVCNTLLEYAENVRDGIYCDAAFLPILYMARDDDDWRDPKVWKKANPNLGISVSVEFLEAECKKAERIVSYQNTFRRLYLNQRTAQVNRWIDLADWDACSGLENGETPQQWRERIYNAALGVPCWGGLDLGSVSDLTALALLFDGDYFDYPGALVVLPYFWCPEISIANKDEKNQALYQEWEMNGFLSTTEGNVTDYRTIRRDVLDISNHCPFIDLAIDRLYQGGQLATELLEDGLKVKSFGQNFTDFTAPSKDFEIRVKSGRIIHGGNPMLRWQAGNVMVKEGDGETIKPVKPAKNSNQKIDGIVSTIMALGVQAENPNYAKDEDLILV